MAWDALQELQGFYLAEHHNQTNQTPRRFADLYAGGQIPENQEVVDTIFGRALEILAYHTTTTRATNGPIEGINNLNPNLRRSPTAS